LHSYVGTELHELQILYTTVYVDTVMHYVGTKLHVYEGTDLYEIM
jgi:hypothetical protein